jgi:hypothetical protein
MTEDAAQRSIWTFYEVVNFERGTIEWRLVSLRKSAFGAVSAWMSVQQEQFAMKTIMFHRL